MTEGSEAEYLFFFLFSFFSFFFFCTLFLIICLPPYVNESSVTNMSSFAGRQLVGEQTTGQNMIIRC